MITESLISVILKGQFHKNKTLLYDFWDEFLMYKGALFCILNVYSDTAPLSFLFLTIIKENIGFRGSAAW